MQIRLKGYFTISLSRSVWWFRRDGGRCYMVKAPWAAKLFSERYGYWPHVTFCGFRFGSRE